MRARTHLSCISSQDCPRPLIVTSPIVPIERTSVSWRDRLQPKVFRPLSRRTGSLFDPESEQFQSELAGLATKDQFAGLARSFFARLTQKTLEYYISRELPNHVGPGTPVPSVDSQIAFRTALQRHCREASLIVEQFAGGWYSKSNFKGTLTPASAEAFAAYALKKMRDELRARGSVNA